MQFIISVFTFRTEMLLSSWTGLVLLILFVFSVLRICWEDGDFDLVVVCFSPFGIIVVPVAFFAYDTRIFDGCSLFEKIFTLIFYMTFPAWVTAHLVRSIWFV